MIVEWIAVALGGMLGALLRHFLTWVFSLVGPSWLPIATLTANLAGCFAIGALVQWSLHHQITSHWYVVGTRVGFLGGLTTFSSFGLDVVRFWNEDRPFHTLLLVAAHIIIGLAAVMAGMACMRAEQAGEAMS